MQKILFVLLSFISVNLWAYPHEKFVAFCHDVVMTYCPHANQPNVTDANGTFTATIVNGTSIDQTYHIEGKIIDTETHLSKLVAKDVTIMPNKEKTVDFDGPQTLSLPIYHSGKRFFNVVLDVTGERNFHSEAQCHILAKKEDNLTPQPTNMPDYSEK